MILGTLIGAFLLLFIYSAAMEIKLSKIKDKKKRMATRLEYGVMLGVVVALICIGGLILMEVNKQSRALCGEEYMDCMESHNGLLDDSCNKHMLKTCPNTTSITLG